MTYRTTLKDNSQTENCAISVGNNEDPTTSSQLPAISTFAGSENNNGASSTGCSTAPTSQGSAATSQGSDMTTAAQIAIDRAPSVVAKPNYQEPPLPLLPTAIVKPENTLKMSAPTAIVSPGSLGGNHKKIQIMMSSNNSSNNSNPGNHIKSSNSPPSPKASTAGTAPTPSLGRNSKQPAVTSAFANFVKANPNLSSGQVAKKFDFSTLTLLPNHPRGQSKKSTPASSTKAN